MNLKKPDFDLSQVKVPQVVHDVYQDLRDRKLLPIVALIAVAIGAGPIVAASGGGATPKVTETTPAEVVPAPEAQSAVLAEDPGLRNYQKRLDDLKAHNPFDQQYTATVTGVSEETDTGSSAGASGGSTSISVGGGDTGSSSTPSSSSGGGATTAADVVTDNTTVNVDENGGGGSTQPSLLAFRVDLHFGPEGGVDEYKNVELLDVLDPVGAFIGGTQSGSKAAFAMSSGVAAVTGEGQCAPSPGDCQFLLLRKGKTANITYQPPDDSAAVVYKLAVDDIRLVKVDRSDLDGRLGD